MTLGVVLDWSPSCRPQRRSRCRSKKRRLTRRRRARCRERGVARIRLDRLRVFEACPTHHRHLLTNRRSNFLFYILIDL